MQEQAELAIGKSHVTSRHLHQIADTAYDATIKGAEEAFGIGCLHELKGTIGSIADELGAEILCDWALVSASKALEQSRFEFAHDQERRASDEAIIDVTADYNVSSIFSIGGAAPLRFFEPGVRKPLTVEVTIKCFVKGARAGGDTTEGSENLVYNTRGVGVCGDP